MELWTEYEGRTIDGAFPLKRLLLPEGRSAFFSTLNGAGNPTVIRLIESHFDEEEILARWRGVEALKHPNLLKLEQFGQLKLDETTVIYAVMEPVEANLGEVVGQQRITVAEAKDLASSLASALDVLHTHGFVHEHVEASNIFAVGDLVKLRSDCIREAPEEYRGAEAKKRDVRDLAGVLLQALTQQRTLEAAARDLPLPSPFDQIVRKGLSGEWGLAEIKAALPTAKRPAIVPPAAVEAAPAVAAPKLVETPKVVGSTNAIEPPSVKRSPRERIPVVGAPTGIGSAKEQIISSASTPSAKQIALPLDAAEPEAKASDAVLFPERRLSFYDEPEEPKRFGRPGMIAAGVLAGLLTLGVAWHFASQPSTNTSKSSQATAPVVPATGQSNAAEAATSTPTVSKSLAGKPAASKPAAHGVGSVASAAPGKSATADGRVQWRVVAYTFNHQDQARSKVEAIAKAHPNLRPEVFSISGHAPFLVTVGGAMNKDEAFAFVQKARSAGMPHDSYAQNYSSKGR